MCCPRVNVRFGSEADISACLSDVRFTPKSGHQITVQPSPLVPQADRADLYSITSSARSSLRPRDFRSGPGRTNDPREQSIAPVLPASGQKKKAPRTGLLDRSL